MNLASNQLSSADRVEGPLQKADPTTVILGLAGGIRESALTLRPREEKS
jgi:hypothetical protein